MAAVIVRIIFCAHEANKEETPNFRKIKGLIKEFIFTFAF